MSETVLQLVRLHARDRQGAGGRTLGRIGPLSLTLGAGIHAFVGQSHDGVAALCEVLIGRTAPRSGALWLRGQRPHRQPQARASIAGLLRQPSLPPLADVAALLTLAKITASVFEEVVERLEAPALGKRKLATLQPREARTLELCMALAQRSARLLVLHEPFLEVAGCHPAKLRAELAERAAAGVCVVIGVAAAADVEGLQAQLFRVASGRVSAYAEALGDDRVRLWIGAAEPAKRLLTRLAQEPELQALSCHVEEDGRALLVLRGGEPQRLAAVIAAAVLEVGAPLLGMDGVLPPGLLPPAAPPAVETPASEAVALPEPGGVA